MTQEEILQYNKMCADFVGLKISIKPKDEYYCVTWYKLSDNKDEFIPSPVLYHSDWNCIMEVVDAIENLDVKDAEYISNYSVVIYNNTCYIEVCGYKSYTVIQEITASSKKEAVVQAINQFLIWYNDKQ